MALTSRSEEALTLTIDTAGHGLAMMLKDYQQEALHYIWAKGEGASSRDVWSQVNKKLKTRSISRASIINFLNAMVDEGVLNYTEITGKGGHRRIYSTKLNEAQFKQYVAEVVLRNLIRDFPAETKEAINKIK
jgi:predicted transcriptional regulator